MGATAVRRAVLAASALAGSFVVSAPMPASANDIAYSSTVLATDFASFGVGGVRGGDGNASIVVAGITGTVTKALLYWDGPDNPPDANAAITFAGAPTAGTLIGISADNCWGFTESRAYRADVTASVAGNGTYPVANLINGGADINGLSLLVFFDDGNSANNRDVVLFEGNDSNVNANGFDADGWNVSLAGVQYTAGSATLQLHVADGQGFPDGSVEVNGTTIAADDPITGADPFGGTTVPDMGTAATTSGGLWDIRSFDVTALLTPGPNTLTVTHTFGSDCLSLIIAAVDLPAGAAPPPPVLPEAPYSALLPLSLVGAGTIALIVRRRRSTSEEEQPS